jgi:hypothetical protein
MTLRLAQEQLMSSVEELWSVVGDLVIIAMEDQPSPPTPAAFDDLVNDVSEIQAGVATARATLRADVDRFGPALPSVAAHLDDARTRYWRVIRAYEPTAARHLAARRAGGQWPTWLDTVEKSANACEGPFDAASAAVHLCWQEVIS